MVDPLAPRPHEDPALFREAVRVTAAETGFAQRLIEKDYFCTLILGHLATTAGQLVFKGGTCLAKVHAGFYRLSEDLDFSISIPIDATRAARSGMAAPPKQAIAAIPRRIAGVHLGAPLTGANDSSQYQATLTYSSLLSPVAESVRVEIGLREPLLRAPVTALAQTLLRDPITGGAMVPPLELPCLSREEAMAEKLRAALSRREPAIRDFYDVDHAVRRLGLDLANPEIVQLVGAKLRMPGNAPVDVSRDRLAALRRQVTGQLRPVLRDTDYEEFDLDRAFAAVVQLADALGAVR